MVSPVYSGHQLLQTEHRRVRPLVISEKVRSSGMPWWASSFPIARVSYDR